MVIWLIGLSGAGKTVVGEAVTLRLRNLNRSVVFMDGDIWRSITGNDLGYSLEDRKKNAKRICSLCQYLETQGVDVVFSVLSLFHEFQNWNRKHLKKYYEVYLRVSLTTIKERDSKGLYQKIESGKIKDVVGIDIPFVEPCQPNIIIDNNKQSIDVIADVIINDLKAKTLI